MARQGGGRLHVGFAMDWSERDRARILAACPPEISLAFLAAAPRDHDKLARLDVLVVGTQPIAAALMDMAPRLRLIQRWGTGMDNIDLAQARRRGIATAELTGANARSVSEFVLLSMLSLLRNLPDIAVTWAEGRWPAPDERRPGRRLQGKTVGLLGFGAIGQDLAALLQPFEVAILCHDLAPPVTGLRAEPVTKERLLAAADIVSVQLPLSAQTRGAIGEAEIALMKHEAILVSVSRAGIVDEQAVRKAVLEGRLRAASFDNFAQEPLPPAGIAHQAGILATPHIGGGCVEGFDALLAACFASIMRFRGG